MFGPNVKRQTIKIIGNRHGGACFTFILALRRQRLVEDELEASLVYTGRPYLKNNMLWYICIHKHTLELGAGGVSQ